MDIVLNEIRRGFIEMDRFWVEEVHRVTKAPGDRRLDSGDMENWQRIQESLGQTITRYSSPRIVVCQIHQYFRLYLRKVTATVHCAPILNPLYCILVFVF